KVLECGARRSRKPQRGTILRTTRQGDRRDRYQRAGMIHRRIVDGRRKNERLRIVSLQKGNEPIQRQRYAVSDVVIGAREKRHTAPGIRAPLLEFSIY